MGLIERLKEMMGNYIQVGKMPIQCDDILEWAQWFEKADRTVAKTHFVGDIEVSTVFLGLDHSFGGGGEPLLYETMIFGGKEDGYQERCSTWEQAEAMHQKAVDLLISQGLEKTH